MRSRYVIFCAAIANLILAFLLFFHYGLTVGIIAGMFHFIWINLASFFFLKEQLSQAAIVCLVALIVWVGTGITANQVLTARLRKQIEQHSFRRLPYRPTDASYSPDHENLPWYFIDAPFSPAPLVSTFEIDHCNSRGVGARERISYLNIGIAGLLIDTTTLGVSCD